MKVTIEKQEFKMNGFSFPIKPQVAAECLLDIYMKNDNQLTAEAVVETAKLKSNPLHPCFEWDDKIAGQEYRLVQARKLIGCVVIKKEINDEKREVKAFINVKEDKMGLSHNPFAHKNSRYVFVDDAMNDEYLRQYTVESAMLELQRWINKYKSVKELADFFEMIESQMKKKRA